MLDATAALALSDYDNAFEILSASADSFATIDPLAPTRKRLEFEDILFAHGLRYGGQGLPLAIRMNRDALDAITSENQTELWGYAQNSLANALANQGKRIAGQDGNALLEKAVTANHAALTVFTQEQHPLEWSGIQNNLALTLQNVGTRTGGQNGNALLQQAAKAFRAALTVCTQEQHPVQWAMIQNNLALTLATQGTRTDGQDGNALLDQAVATFRAALIVRTREQYPAQWAMTQNNLAGALQTQGTRTKGKDGNALLAQAVSVYRAALTERTQAQHPMDWAMTQNNLAGALATQGYRNDEENRADSNAFLAKAIVAFRAALTVYTQAQNPVDWAMIQENLALLFVEFTQQDDPENPLESLQQALDHVDAALAVYDPDHMPYNHDKATKLREGILAALATLNPES